MIDNSNRTEWNPIRSVIITSHKQISVKELLLLKSKFPILFWPQFLRGMLLPLALKETIVVLLGFSQELDLW